MASIRLDLPEPVGPVRAKRSAPSKSTSTVSRNAVKPSTSRRSGRIGTPRVAELVVQLPEQGQQPLVLHVLLGQVLGEELVGRAAQPGGRGSRRRRLRRGRADTCTALGRSSRTSSARPARAGSSTSTRSQASPTSLASARRSAKVPRSVRRARPDSSGTGRDGGRRTRAPPRRPARPCGRPPRRSRGPAGTRRTRPGRPPPGPPGSGGGGRGRRSAATAGKARTGQLVLEDRVGRRSPPPMTPPATMAWAASRFTASSPSRPSVRCSTRRRRRSA